MHSWKSTGNALSDVLEDMRAINRPDDVIEQPSEDERRQLTLLYAQIRRQVDELARRAGISEIVPGRLAPDWGTCCNDADRLLAQAADRLRNHNPQTPPNGGALGYSRRAIDDIGRARENLACAEAAHLGV